MASIFEWFDRRAQMEQALTERGVTNPPERGQEENTEPKDSLAVRPPKEEESNDIGSKRDNLLKRENTKPIELERESGTEDKPNTSNGGEPRLGALPGPYAILNVVYPIFTFRWLAVHTLAVPTVFFLGAISSMQFLQR